MTLIQRYLFRQMLLPVLGAVAALMAVTLLTQSLSVLDIIVERGQSPLVLGKITLLALPPLVALILPMGLFIGLLLSLNRLQTDQEVVICYASGMSRWQVVNPAVRLSLLFVLATLVLNLFVQPLAYRALRAEYFRVRTDFASTLVREGEFVQAAQGLTVYAQSVDQNGLLKNLFIHVQRPNGATAYAAQEGRIAKRGDAPVLIMRQGSSEEFSGTGVLNYLSFDQYAFDLSPFLKNDEVFRYKASDRWLHELLFPNTDFVWEKKNALKLLADGHSRLATPLYSLAFAALALVGVLGGPYSRLGYNRRIVRVAAIAAVARIVGFGILAGAASNAWLNILQYAVPIGVTVFACRALFRQKIRRYVPITKRRERLAAAGAAAS
jgi:lipopolysaccharide export system permease protein